MKRLLLVALASFILVNCTSDELDNKIDVVIGFSADLKSLNPMFAYTFNDGNVSELLFQSLVRHRWDYERAELTSEPMLAENWEWSADSSSIIVNIKNDVFWSDSVNLTVHDIAFSFDVYSDPAVQSRAMGYFENFHTDENGRINVDRTFEILSDYSIKIIFGNYARPSIIDLDHPILPKHALESIDRPQLRNSEFNQNPITSGPFKVENWVRNQALYLAADKGSGFFKPGSIERIIFKIVPDYNSRILQLENGELDLVENVKAEDVDKLKQNDQLVVKAVGERAYDYIGWNQIEIRDGKYYPNRFFSNGNVRKAITHALNREEVLSEFLYNYGKLAAGPVSPLYKDAFDETIVPLKYDPELAKQILSNEGWIDTDGDGILDKDGLDFSFEIYIATGNPRRKYAATLFKSDLRIVGIEVELQFIERGAFIDGIYSKKYDSWMDGFFIPLPINLKIFLHSDPGLSPLNFMSYANEEVDLLLDKMDQNNSREEYFSSLKKINQILQHDQPISFLYWIDRVTVYNNSIYNIDFNPLGVVHHCWEWSIN